MFAYHVKHVLFFKKLDEQIVGLFIPPESTGLDARQRDHESQTHCASECAEARFSNNSPKTISSPIRL